VTEHGEFEKEDNRPHVMTAFMVVVDTEGKAYAILEPPSGVVIDQMPTMVSVKRACTEIVDDINAQIAGSYAAQFLVAQKVEEKPADAVARAMEKRNAFRRGAHEAQDAYVAHHHDEE
jgi:hypothetical protein